MSAPPMNGNGGPPQTLLPQPPMLPNGQTAEDPALVTQALLKAARTSAEKALTAQGQDCKDYATASLNFAQAVVILDPELSQGGTPLEHDIAIKTIEGQTQAQIAQIQAQAQIATEQQRGENAIRQAKETAAAPTPRKSVSVRRDGSGRLAGFDEEG